MNKFLFLFFFLVLHSSFKVEVSELRPAKDFALFIAVSDYEEWQDLRNPVSDAKAVAKELENNFGFTTEVMTNPKKNEIYQALEHYRKMTFDEDAQLLIFISGHGDFREESTEGFFIPKDGKVDDPFQDTYIPHTRLERMVDNIPCNHILLAIDACFSGTFDEDIAMSRGPAFKRPGENQQSEIDLFIKRKLQYKSRLYLTSGGKERTPDGKNYSPYTQRFLEGLRSYGGGDNLLTFTELLSFMEKAVPAPRSGSFGSHEPGGDVLFISDSSLGNDISFEKPEEEKLSSNSRESSTGNDRNEPPQLIDNTPEPTSSSIQYGEVKAGGKTYKTLEIEGMTWLAENLNIKTVRDSWCYDQDESNCDKYGRLYLQQSAMQGCASLGKGWVLASHEDWKALTTPYATAQEAYHDLLEGGSSGFNAKLGGLLEYGYDYARIEDYGAYITRSNARNNDPIIFLFSKRASTIEMKSGSKSIKYSCRCVNIN